jgi:hypothetical protein
MIKGCKAYMGNSAQGNVTCKYHDPGILTKNSMPGNSEKGNNLGMPEDGKVFCRIGEGTPVFFWRLL